MTPAAWNESSYPSRAVQNARPLAARAGLAVRAASGPDAHAAVSTLLCDPPPDPGNDFDGFYRSIFPKLRAMLFARCRDWSLAEDTAQETMIICHRKWSDLSDTQPDRFAVTVARRLLSRAQMTMAKRQEEPLSLLEPVIPLARDVLANAGADSALIDRIMVEAAIRALSARQAEVVVLFYKLGYTIDEIAQELELRPGTVKSHLHTGRSRLAELLNGHTRPEDRRIA